MSTEAPMAKAPRRARGVQRVTELLDAGSTLFAQKGYEATTMTEIAQLAGASIGSLYQFFSSKRRWRRDFLVATWSEYRHGWKRWSRARQAIAQTTGGPAG